MVKVLVTGGAGFIGSHLVDALVADGHDVLVVDNLSSGKKEYVHREAQLHVVDIREYSALEPLIGGVDAVFHLAAEPRLQMSLEQPLETHAVNVTGTLNVLEAARVNGVKSVLFASSCTVYGNSEQLPLREDCPTLPVSPYGVHKLQGEQYMRLYGQLFGMRTVSLRLFNVFGPRKTADGAYPMVIPIFLKQKKAGEPLTIVGDGEQTRDYVHVTDVARAFVAAWQADMDGNHVFNVGSGKQYSVNAIASIIGGTTTSLPAREGEMRFVEADISLIRGVLGWTPQVSLEDGVARLM